jgi:hypothetical protein
MVVAPYRLFKVITPYYWGKDAGKARWGMNLARLILMPVMFGLKMIAASVGFVAELFNLFNLLCLMKKYPFDASYIGNCASHYYNVLQIWEEGKKYPKFLHDAFSARHATEVNPKDKATRSIVVFFHGTLIDLSVVVGRLFYLVATLFRNLFMCCQQAKKTETQDKEGADSKTNKTQGEKLFDILKQIILTPLALVVRLFALPFSACYKPALSVCNWATNTIYGDWLYNPCDLSSQNKDNFPCDLSSQNKDNFWHPVLARHLADEPYIAKCFQDVKSDVTTTHTMGTDYRKNDHSSSARVGDSVVSEVEMVAVLTALEKAI